MSLSSRLFSVHRKRDLIVSTAEKAHSTDQDHVKTYPGASTARQRPGLESILGAYGTGPHTMLPTNPSGSG